MSRLGPAAGRALVLGAVVLAATSGFRWARYAARRPVAAVPALGADSVATLLVVLRSSDCASHGPLLAGWDRLHAEEGVRVVGAVVDAPGSAAARDSLERGFRVGFPLRFDVGEAAEELVLRLGYRATPVSVLLDRRGRARMVLPPGPDPAAVETAVRVAFGHIALIRSAGAGP